MAGSAARVILLAFILQLLKDASFPLPVVQCPCRVPFYDCQLPHSTETQDCTSLLGAMITSRARITQNALLCNQEFHNMLRAA